MFFWNIATHIYLCITYNGRIKGHNRDQIAHKTQNSKYLALDRKHLPTPGLGQWFPNFSLKKNGWGWERMEEEHWRLILQDEGRTLKIYFMTSSLSQGQYSGDIIIYKFHGYF